MSECHIQPTYHNIHSKMSKSCQSHRKVVSGTPGGNACVPVALTIGLHHHQPSEVERKETQDVVTKENYTQTIQNTGRYWMSDILRLKG